MADTRRNFTALQTLFADNIIKAITPQSLRDFLVSVMGYKATALPSTTLTLDNDSEVVIVDATAGAVTVNLPAAGTVQGKVYTIKKKDSSGNAVTVDPNSTETIDGASTYVLNAQYKYVTIIAQNSGNSWWVIANN